MTELGSFIIIWRVFIERNTDAPTFAIAMLINLDDAEELVSDCAFSLSFFQWG